MCLRKRKERGKQTEKRNMFNKIRVALVVACLGVPGTTGEDAVLANEFAEVNCVPTVRAHLIKSDYSIVFARASVFFFSSFMCRAFIFRWLLIALINVAPVFL